MHRTSFALLVAAGLLWGTGGLTGRALADSSGLSPGAVAAYRLGLGGALLIILAIGRRRPRPRGRAQWMRISAVAALAATFQCAYFAAVAAASVSAATLITIGCAPIFVVIAQAVRSRQRPSRSVIRPVVTGVVGLALLVGAPAGGGGLAASLGGAALAAVSGAAFAGFALLGRHPLPDIDELSVAGYGFLLGGLGLATGTLPFASLGFAPSARNLGLLVLLATVPTALAYALFFRGLRQATAAIATVVALLEPLTATVLAVIFVGDRLTALGAVGAVLLLASVLDAGRTQLIAPVRQ
jgi:drug/metabolite transporter, DME family